MADVAVMTDTVSYIPEEILNQYHIIQVPAHVIIGDKAYPENEMDLADLYTKIPKWREENNLPTTSSPSPEEFVQAYRQLSRDYQAIVYVGYSTKLGMAVQSASLARDLVKDELPQTEIEILDANTAFGAQMLITLEAARAASAGGSFKKVVTLAREMINKVNFLYLSDDLYHLAKGGRINWARPWADSKICNTVILEMTAANDGQITPVARCRTKGETLETLFKLVESRSGGKKLHVAINHSDTLAEAEQLKERALSQFQCEEVFINNIGPLVTVHTGLVNRFFCWWAE